MASGQSCCQKLRGKKGVKYSLFLTSFSVFLLGISIFLPGWRSDSIGTTPLRGDYLLVGFDWKEYGLIQSRATVNRAWGTITNEVCNFAALGQVSQGVALMSSATSGNVEGCAGRESCMNGFHIHMQARCVGYQKIMKISFISMALTGVAVLMGIIASLLAALASKKRIGGVTFGLYMTAVVFSMVANVAWCFMTDSVFKDLAKTAWYPYPSLSWAWYMNVVAISLLLVGDVWFGKLVLPQVWAYDPQQEKIAKRDRKHQAMQQRQQKQAMAGMYAGQPGMYPQYQGGTMPPPPGYDPRLGPGPGGPQQYLDGGPGAAQHAGFLANDQVQQQFRTKMASLPPSAPGGFQGVAYSAGAYPGGGPLGPEYQVSPQPPAQHYGQGDMRQSGMAVPPPMGR